MIDAFLTTLGATLGLAAGIIVSAVALLLIPPGLIKRIANARPTKKED